MRSGEPRSDGKGEPMSLATPVTAPRSRISPLPFYIIIFCLLWSSGFVPSKVGVTDCPPLIFLTVRFLIAGMLILGISALRGEKWNLSRRDVVAFVLVGTRTTRFMSGSDILG